MNKILVTGAAGFIGSHLTEKLLRQGFTVVGLDNFNDYYDPQKKRANQKYLNQFPNFTMVEEDIRNQEFVSSLFREQNFTAVAHLAALAGVRNAVQYPALYVDVDYNGSQTLMDAARETDVSNFVFASTSSVYGATKQIPFIETDPCDRPLQPYAAAKRGVEMLGYTYHYLYKMNFTALRFFTVYGPNGRPDMMAYLVADSVTKGREIPLYDGGKMYRDWTFVGDITDGIVAALKRPFGYEIINVGRGEPVLLQDFVELFEQLAGQKGNFIHKPRIKADVSKTYANIDKAHQLLDYTPKISVEEGVNQFWNWYIQQD